MPHLESDVAKRLAPKNAEQSRYWELIQQPGDLTLATQIDVRGWLYPTVQPNSKLDYPRSDDHWIREQEVRLRSALPFTATFGETPTQLESQAVDGQFEVKFSIAQESPALIPLTIRLQTGKGNPSFRIDWNATCADGSRHEGPTPLHRLVVPWARLDATDPTKIHQRVIPELAGGSWGRGRQVFLSEQAGCSKCHVAHGAGGQLGPDLSNLIHRDYPSVLRDLTLPSFAINPDFITYTALTHDGRALTGVVRSDAERVYIGDKDGKVTQLLRTDIDDLRPSAVSVMPEGIPTLLGPDRIKDLMAFLLKPPPTMPTDANGPASAARRRDEVAKILAGRETSSEQILKAPLKILLVAGKKDHGPGEHDYPAWLSVWSELLAAAPGITIDTAMEWPLPEQIAAADSIVFYQKGQWNDERAQAIDSHLAKGRGLVYIHWAVEGSENATAFAERIGLASNALKIKYRHGPLDLTFNQDDHPIARNFDRVHFHDESYWLLQGDPKRLRVLGTGIEEGESRPLFWTVESNHGRVFVSILGHYSWTFDDPLFRAVMLRGIAWSAGQPVDRFNDLVTLGVELK